MEVFRRRRKTQAFDGTTFSERLKPLFVYHFHRCVGNYHKGVQGGVAVLVVLVVVEVIVGADMRVQLLMRG